MSDLNIKVIAESLEYTGRELSPHFILQKFRIEENALVAYRGPCMVKTDHLVDWEDRIQGSFIQAKEMIHIQGEFFGLGLKEGVLFQRLWVAKLGETLRTRMKEPHSLIRKGNDIYFDSRKLNVSIVTATPVSILFHLGINWDASGAPVPAASLRELGVEKWDDFSQELLQTFREEWKGVNRACTKVRPVMSFA